MSKSSSFHQVIIETDRLWLRCVTLDDSPALFELNRDPYSHPAHIMPPMPVSTIPMIQSGQYQM